jgi:hypothetical protein
MAVHQPAPVPDPTALSPGERLASWVAAREAEVATAMRLIAAGGRSNDSCLHARQFLEQALGDSQRSPLTGTDYQRAASLLDGSGKTQLGAAMDALGSVSWELQAATPAWHNRYAARPQTQPERIAADQIRNGDVVESGHAGPGIDGAHYSRAYYPRSGKPAIVITTSAMTEEIVNFANTEDAAAWLAARSAKITGPLPTSVTGPASRTAREEELLAFLAREPGRGAPLAAMAGPATFTTHLRAELFAAWRWATAAGGTPGYSVITEAYGRRLLRAPVDAAEHIGWPNATRAMAYLNRLVITPVTESQAAAAAGLLASVDAAASLARPQPTTTAQRARRVTAVIPAPEAGRLLQQPPALSPGRGSPAPRLLAHPERTRLTAIRPISLPASTNEKRAATYPPITCRWRRELRPPGIRPPSGSREQETTMPRRGSARADAIRRAHEAKAARDAARQHRETLIESALADYYQAAAIAERIRDTARRKCEELLAEAERTAEPQDAAAAQSVRRLRDLLGGIPETAELCGLTVTAIRDLLAGRPDGQRGGTADRAAHSDGEHP